MYKKVHLDLNHRLDFALTLKVGDRVKHMTGIFGNITEILDHIFPYLVKWDNITDEIKHEARQLSLAVNTGQIVAVKNTCLCDSRQLFNFGHDKGCTKL